MLSLVLGRHNLLYLTFRKKNQMEKDSKGSLERMENTAVRNISFVNGLVR